MDRSAGSVPRWFRIAWWVVVAFMLWFQTPSPNLLNTLLSTPPFAWLIGAPKIGSWGLDFALLVALPAVATAVLAFSGLYRERLGPRVALYAVAGGAGCLNIQLNAAPYTPDGLLVSGVLLVLLTCIVATTLRSTTIPWNRVLVAIWTTGALCSAHFAFSYLPYLERPRLSLLYVIPISVGIAAHLVLRWWPVGWIGTPRFTSVLAPLLLAALAMPIASYVVVGEGAYQCVEGPLDVCSEVSPSLDYLEQTNASLTYALHIDEDDGQLVSIARQSWCIDKGIGFVRLYDLDDHRLRGELSVEECERVDSLHAEHDSRSLVLACSFRISRVNIDRCTVAEQSGVYHDVAELEAIIPFRGGSEYLVSTLPRSMLIRFDGETLQELGRIYFADWPRFFTQLHDLSFIEPGLILTSSSTRITVFDGSLNPRAQVENYGFQSRTAVDPLRKRLFVSDALGGTLGAYELPTLRKLAEIRIPRGVDYTHVSPEQGIVVVAPFLSAEVEVYSANDLSLLGRFNGGPQPRDFAFLPGTDEFFGTSACGVYRGRLSTVLTHPFRELGGE